MSSSCSALCKYLRRGVQQITWRQDTPNEFLLGLQRACHSPLHFSHSEYVSTDKTIAHGKKSGRWQNVYDYSIGQHITSSALQRTHFGSYLPPFTCLAMKAPVSTGGSVGGRCWPCGRHVVRTCNR